MNVTLSIYAFAFVSVPVLAGTTLTDPTFNLANYTETPVFNTNPGNATLTFSQCSSCGNPGQGLKIVASLFSDGVGVGFVNNTFTYNPANQEPIISINVSVDKDLSFNQTETVNNVFRPLIAQDGIFYLAAISGPSLTGTTTGYLTLSQAGLTAADFSSFDFGTGNFGNAHPNFSGDSMQFGLAQIIFGTFAPAPFVIEADYDNLNLSVIPAPEPSSLLLLGAGSAGLFMWAQRSSSRFR